MTWISAFSNCFGENYVQINTFCNIIVYQYAQFRCIFLSKFTVLVVDIAVSCLAHDYCLPQIALHVSLHLLIKSPAAACVLCSLITTNVLLASCLQPSLDYPKCCAWKHNSCMPISDVSDCLFKHQVISEYKKARSLMEAVGTPKPNSLWEKLFTEVEKVLQPRTKHLIFEFVNEKSLSNA